MSMAVKTRLFQAADEARVRRICFETALYGQSIQPLLDDEKLVTDALIGYYLRFEREALFVADVGRTVAGYLAGCADSRRFDRLYRRHVVPDLLRQFLVRGYWLRPRLLRLVLANAGTGLRWWRARQAVLGEYPAHLHINLDASNRKLGIGRMLVEQCLALLDRRGVAGVHISTETDAGRAFFGKVGFDILRTYRIRSVADRSPLDVTLMGRRLGNANREERR